MTISNIVSVGARRILELVAEHGLADGSRLPSAQSLATTFGISIIQVREAVKYLESIGVLEVSHGRGIFVRLRTSVIDDLLEVRRLVECHSARVAATIRTEQDVAALRLLLEQMQQAMREGRADQYTDLDLRFHRAIAEIAGNPIVGRVLDNVRTVMQFHLSAINVEPRVLRISMSVHEEIVALIEARDADAAEDAMRKHMSDISAKYQAYMNRRLAHGHPPMAED